MNRNRVLQVALAHGREIYGKEFPSDTRALLWLSVKAAQGCPLSRQLLMHIPTEMRPAGTPR